MGLIVDMLIFVRSAQMLENVKKTIVSMSTYEHFFDPCPPIHATPFKKLGVFCSNTIAKLTQKWSHLIPCPKFEQGTFFIGGNSSTAPFEIVTLHFGVKTANTYWARESPWIKFKCRLASFNFFARIAIYRVQRL